MPVVDLEQLVILDAAEVVGRDGPAEVGVIDRRQRAGAADRVYVALDRLDEARSALRRDQLLEMEGVYVDRFLFEMVGHLLATDEQEFLRRAEDGIQAVDRGEVV